MPLFTYECPSGHSRDVYYHRYSDREQGHVFCDECEIEMHPIFSPGTPLVYFGEGGGSKTIHNLGPTPVEVTSHKHHRELMKAAGVDWAPARRGMKGCWGG